MIGSLLMAVTLAASTGGSAEALTKFQPETDTKAKPLTISVPTAWEHAKQDSTDKFKASTGEAFFTLDISTVQKKAGIDPQECVNKIIAALEKNEHHEHWETLKVGSNPAAKTVTVDKVDKEGAQQLWTVMYVGCNGKTTWTLSFSTDEKKKDLFEPLATQIVQSISYAKGK